MADDNKGWNQLKRNTETFKTDNIPVEEKVSVHDTYTFDKDGNIKKPHTTVSADDKTKRIGH